MSLSESHPPFFLFQDLQESTSYQTFVHYMYQMWVVYQIWVGCILERPDLRHLVFIVYNQERGDTTIHAVTQLQEQGAYLEVYLRGGAPNIVSIEQDEEAALCREKPATVLKETLSSQKQPTGMLKSVYIPCYLIQQKAGYWGSVVPTISLLLKHGGTLGSP